MVDFGEIRNKAEGFVSEHDEGIKQGIDKLGDFLGNKIGHDKVDPMKEKLSGFVDSLGDDKPTPPTTPPGQPQ